MRLLSTYNARLSLPRSLAALPPTSFASRSILASHSRNFDTFARKVGKFTGRVLPVVKALGGPPQADPSLRGQEAFLAPREVTFESIGLAEPVVTALQLNQVSQPSRIQATAVPEILGGHNVVIASETGSGKTYAYLAPLLQKILQRKAAAAAAAAGAAGDAGLRGGVCQAVILCPTNLIVQQVLEVVRSMRGSDGLPLITAAKLSAATLGLAAPDLAVTTPPALTNFLDVAENLEDSRWFSPETFVKNVRHIILDEVDVTLLGHEASCLRLLERFRVDDHRRTGFICRAELGITAAEWDAIGRDLKGIANKRGVAEFLKVCGREGGKATKTEPFYWNRQYVFAGATVPDTGTKGVVARLIDRYPDLVFVQGEQLHGAKKEIEYTFKEVDPDDRNAALLEAVRAAPRRAAAAAATPAPGGRATGRTLVFCEGLQTVEEVTAFLQKSGVKSVAFHMKMLLVDRDAAFRRMQHESDVAIVCTDAAARGVDLPGIDHVIHYDFARSAVDFLHRSGRTARAGRSGRVTALFLSRTPPGAEINLENQKALAEYIREKIESEEPLEKAFSRNRSFRTKLKRFGTALEPSAEEMASRAEDRLPIGTDEIQDLIRDRPDVASDAAARAAERARATRPAAERAAEKAMRDARAFARSQAEADADAADVSSSSASVDAPRGAARATAFDVGDDIDLEEEMDRAPAAALSDKSSRGAELARPAPAPAPSAPVSEDQEPPAPPAAGKVEDEVTPQQELSAFGDTRQRVRSKPLRRESSYPYSAGGAGRSDRSSDRAAPRGARGDWDRDSVSDSRGAFGASDRFAPRGAAGSGYGADRYAAGSRDGGRDRDEDGFEERGATDRYDRYDRSDRSASGYRSSYSRGGRGGEGPYGDRWADRSGPARDSRRDVRDEEDFEGGAFAPRGAGAAAGYGRDAAAPEAATPQAAAAAAEEGYEAESRGRASSSPSGPGRYGASGAFDRERDTGRYERRDDRGPRRYGGAGARGYGRSYGARDSEEGEGGGERREFRGRDARDARGPRSYDNESDRPERAAADGPAGGEAAAGEAALEGSEPGFRGPRERSEAGLGGSPWGNDGHRSREGGGGGWGDRDREGGDRERPRYDRGDRGGRGGDRGYGGRSGGSGSGGWGRGSGGDRDRSDRRRY